MPGVKSGAEGSGPSGTVRAPGGAGGNGTGAPPVRAAVGIANGRVVAVAANGDAATLDAENVIDATGLAVAPGFIDLHSHSDWILPQADHGTIWIPRPVPAR